MDNKAGANWGGKYLIKSINNCGGSNSTRPDSLLRFLLNMIESNRDSSALDTCALACEVITSYSRLKLAFGIDYSSDHFEHWWKPSSTDGEKRFNTPKS
jgi:hypothetical protein